MRCVTLNGGPRRMSRWSKEQLSPTFLLSEQFLHKKKYYFQCNNFSFQWQNSMTHVSVALRPPSEGHQHGVSIESSINLGWTLFRITREWKTAQTLILARLFVRQSSIIYLILDVIYWMVAIFISDANHQLGSRRSSPHPPPRSAPVVYWDWPSFWCIANSFLC